MNHKIPSTDETWRMLWDSQKRSIEEQINEHLPEGETCDTHHIELPLIRRHNGDPDDDRVDVVWQYPLTDHRLRPEINDLFPNADTIRLTGWIDCYGNGRTPYCVTEIVEPTDDGLPLRVINAIDM